MRQIQRSSVESQTLQSEASPLPNGGFEESYGYAEVADGDDAAREGFVCLQTGQPPPFHFCRQSQWKTCWQRMVKRPVVSSIRSRHTGQVGSSTRLGVGGGKGLRKVEADVDGVNGS